MFCRIDESLVLVPHEFPARSFFSFFFVAAAAAAAAVYVVLPALNVGGDWDRWRGRQSFGRTNIDVLSGTVGYGDVAVMGVVVVVVVVVLGVAAAVTGAAGGARAAASAVRVLLSLAVLLVLHAPVLEPDLHLPLGQVQVARQLPALLLGHVGVEQEFLLQFQRLELGVGLPLLAHRHLARPLERVRP